MERRINSVENLETIAIGLGSSRTRTELIPFLEGKFLIFMINMIELWDDEDVILIALAE